MNFDMFNCEKYLGVHERQSRSQDVLARILQEKAIEAIFDAGLHPSDLENTKTGVYIGSCVSETEIWLFHNNLVPQSNAWTG
ncbi:hypothetical protein NQ314_005283 [Rhamnusium bicolor]|uniref:Beta-ketoacyl synthase-like N-terminal domain-containing protein n=1 Tax=Rhamnusium bicolor TaxID=1586634 RepID=A0AAV8ZIK3_9CUCU|nr:hypothetical protein NQ314_005283 [Rhamnusium bicolor]